MARFKDIEVGQDYEVGEGSYKRYGRVIEKGTFKKNVSHSRFSYRGTPTEMQGAKVHWLKHGTRELVPLEDAQGLPSQWATEWVRSQAIGRRMDAAQADEARRTQGLNDARARAQRLTGLLQTRGMPYSSCYYSQERGYVLGCSTSDVGKLIVLLESLPPVEEA